MQVFRQLGNQEVLGEEAYTAELTQAEIDTGLRGVCVCVCVCQSMGGGLGEGALSGKRAHAHTLSHIRTHTHSHRRARVHTYTHAAIGSSSLFGFVDQT